MNPRPVATPCRTALAGGAYVVEVDSADGSLSILDGPVDAGINPCFAVFDAATRTACAPSPPSLPIEHLLCFPWTRID